MSLDKKPRGTLTSDALLEIRRLIVGGELKLGEALSETTLATRLGVSKTPVREALLQLKQEGLVEIYPQRGTFVFQVNAAVVRDLCDFRRIIEIAALQRSSRRAWGQLVDTLERCVSDMATALQSQDAPSYRKLDAVFHRSLFQFCDNRLLIEAHDGIEFRIQSLRTRLSATDVNNAATLDEHSAIVQALIARDLDKAQALLTEHITKTEQNYLALLAT